VFLEIEALPRVITATAKWFLVCVNHCVFGKITFHFEGLATNRTGVGFPTMTESDMCLQFTGGVVVCFAEAAFTGSLLGESNMPL
jgi:hypothetical protein